MTRPAFSIVTPTCKRPHLLQRAVRSVVNQTFTDFECIVVDDAGDPATEKIVRQFNDARIVLIQHDRNKGAAAAYNTGIKASQGQLISILDDDDEYCPEFLERMLLFFQTAPPRTGFAWTGIRRVEDLPEGEVFLSEKVWPSRFLNREDAYVAATTIGNGFGLTMKRECLDTVGLYNEGFRVCEDTEHLFRLAERFDFGTIPEVLVKIHSHENDQLTHEDKDALRLNLHERVLTENADFLAHFPELHYIHYRRLAQMCYSLKMRRKGAQILLNLWKRKPRHLSIPADFICYTVYGLDFQTVLHKSKMMKLLKKILR